MVLRIGHRGASGYSPENTISSFEKAVSLICDMAELDVHLCGSGELVVIHDDTVDRTTNGSGKVSTLLLKEIKNLKIGFNETVPTLNEVLSRLRNRIMLNIELKGAGTAKPVFKEINNSGWARDQLLITSFNWDMLKDYRELDPNARIGPLTYRNHLEALEFAIGASAYCINPNHKFLTKEYVDKANKFGIKIFPWTVNKVKDISRILNMNVDGIISDYPDRIK
jgi:glycerophosphoryl diester phosphodiesterase